MKNLKTYQELITERKSEKEIDRIIDSKWESIRDQIINHIMDTHGFDNQVATGIVNYECSNEPGDDYHQVKDMMEQDLLKEREFDIPSMSSKIMDNDEGHYQLDLVK
jgi:hypothetical protein